MYKCDECGGFVEELGEMTVSDGGCVCAQKKAEESANSLQQLKAEIAALIPKLEAIDNITGWQETGPIIRRLRQLSAV